METAFKLLFELGRDAMGRAAEGDELFQLMPGICQFSGLRIPAVVKSRGHLRRIASMADRRVGVGFPIKRANQVCQLRRPVKKASKEGMS
jgi:hypothetical protein